MTTQDDDVNMKKECGGLSGFIWLIAGIGIGAVAAILLAPQSGEDTREWISTKCKAGIDNVNTKVRQTGQQVGDWIDQGQHKVSAAVSAGRGIREGESRKKLGVLVACLEADVHGVLPRSSEAGFL